MTRTTVSMFLLLSLFSGAGAYAGEGVHSSGGESVSGAAMPMPDRTSLGRGSRTATGTFSTSIPIEVPGYHGLAPRLSLEYDSSSGNGPVGVGWRIGGLSTIQRTAPGKGVPAYDANDVYLLDGVELFPCTTGSTSLGCRYPESGATTSYFAKAERYQRIAFHATVWTGWTVTRLDGTKVHYERKWSAGTNDYRWLMTSVVDPSGNIVTYDYTCDTACYPSTIRYNGTTIRFYWEVRPDPASFAIGRGSLATMDRRLRSVAVFVVGDTGADALVRAYTLSYATSANSGRSVLSEVTQLGRDATLTSDGAVSNFSSATKLPPVRVASTDGSDAGKYSPAAGSPRVPEAPASRGEMMVDATIDTYYGDADFNFSIHNKAIQADINGDGLIDQLLVYPGSQSPHPLSNTVGSTTLYLGAYLSNGHGYDRVGGEPYHDDHQIATYILNTVEPQHYFVGDVNGDGNDDLIAVIWLPARWGYSTPHYQISSFIWTGDGFIETQSDLPDWGFEYEAVGSLTSSVERGRFQVGDVNGDGLTDVMRPFVKARSDGTRGWFIKTALSIGSGRYDGDLIADQDTGWDLIYSGGNVRESYERDRWMIGDVNADGRSDLMAVRYTGGLGYPLLCTARGSTVGIDDAVVNGLFQSSCDPLDSYWADEDWWLPGDPNGDGATDFIRVGHDPYNWTMLQAVLSDGTGLLFTPTRVTSTALAWGGSENYPGHHDCHASYPHDWTVVDLDGDGRSDLARLVGNQAGNTVLQGFRSVPDAIPSDLEFVPAGQAPTPLPYMDGCANRHLSLGDVNGDRIADIRSFNIYAGGDAGGGDFYVYTYLEGRLSARDPAQSGSYRDEGRWRSAEVNGDGISDLVLVSALGPGVRVQARVRRAGGAWFEPPPQDFWVGGADGFHAVDIDAFDVADLNGDGKSDLVYVTPMSGGSVKVYSLVSVGWSSWQPTVSTVSFSSGIGLGGFGRVRWIPADVDGDGRADLVHTVRIGSVSTNLRVHVLRSLTDSSGNASWAPSFSDVWPGVGLQTDRGWRALDANGDGRMDLVHFETRTDLWPDDGVVTTLLARPDGAWDRRQSWVTLDHFVNASRFRAMDVNGDGKGDLVHVHVVPGASGYDVRTDLLRSTGDGTWELSSEISWPSFDRPDGIWMPGEMNGDGRRDLVHVHSLRAAFGLRVDTLRSVDDGFVPAPRLANSFPGYTDVRARRWHVADVDGDGVDDLEHVVDNPFDVNTIGVHTMISLAHPDLAVRITNPMGGNTAITYVPSSQRSLDTPCQPRPPVGWVMQTVGRIVVDDGRGTNGSSEGTTFEQTCPMWSHDERALVGWLLSTQSLDAAPHRAARKTVTVHRLDVPACGARLSTVEVQGATGVVLSRDAFAYVSAGTAPPYDCLTDSVTHTECDWMGGGCVDSLVQYGYDDRGNTRYTWEYGDATGGYAVNGDERTTRRGHAFAPALFIDTLERESVHDGIVWQDEGGGNPEWIYVGPTLGPALRLSKYCYDGQNPASSGGCRAIAANRGMMTARMDWDDQTNDWVVTSFDYDSFGNLVSTTDANGMTTVLDYDPRFHVYPVKETNALGQHRDTVWNYVLGRPSYSFDWSSDPLVAGQWRDGKAYDALGRLVQSYQPDGSMTWYSYAEWGNPTLQHVRQQIVDGTSDHLWSRVYLDGLGRAYLERREADGLLASYRRFTVYGDASELVWKQSQWVSESAGGRSSLPVYEVNVYDLLGRPFSTTHPDGTSTQIWYYARQAIAFDELFHAVDTRYDAYGRVSERQEWAGTAAPRVTYEYDAAGQLVTITDDLQNVITQTWDTLGRVIVRDDPDLGSRTYQFDDVGNLLARTDARNLTVTYSYDALNRKQTEIDQSTGRTSTYRYDEAGHGFGVGRLTSIVASADPGCAAQSSFVYDVMGRVSSETRCVDGVQSTTGQTFDLAGRLSTSIYPDGETVSYGYGKAGRLQSVSGLVTNMTYDAADRLLTAQFTDGAQESFTYDPLRQWLTDATVVKNGVTLFDGHYGYHNDAELWWSSSSTHQMNSTYLYDGMHRLTLVTGDKAQTFQYDSLSNMTFNSAVGSYAYPPSGPTGCGSAPCRGVHQAVWAGNSYFFFDEGGNQYAEYDGTTWAPRRFYYWNADSRLESVLTLDPTQGWRWTWFAYDATGERVKKVAPDGSTTRYFGKYAERDPSGALVKYYYAGPRLVARRDGDGTTYYHADRLGSTRVVTRAGTPTDLVARYDYSAYGLKTTASNHDAKGILFTGARQDRETAPPDGTAPGDAENGLVYLNARYYDPVFGRMLTPDTIIPRAPTSMALNRYAYAFNNPISNVDPTGHDPESADWAPINGEQLASEVEDYDPNVYFEDAIEDWTDPIWAYYEEPATLEKEETNWSDGGVDFKAYRLMGGQLKTEAKDGHRMRKIGLGVGAQLEVGLSMPWQVTPSTPEQRVNASFAELEASISVGPLFQWTVTRTEVRPFGGKPEAETRNTFMLFGREIGGGHDVKSLFEIAKIVYNSRNAADDVLMKNASDLYKVEAGFHASGGVILWDKWP